MGFVLAVALTVTWPVTFGGRALLPTGLYLRIQPWRAHAHEFPEFEAPQNPLLDPVQQFYPWRLYAAQAVRDGEIPLWNPQMLSGTPFVANGQSAVFYPETWLHYVMPPLSALGWATLMFYLIAGWGMYWLLRVLGTRPVAAAIGAVVFMLSGFFTGWLTFPTVRSTAAWLPWALVGIELSVRRRPAWLLVTVVAVGMQFLAGHLQISIYVLLGVVAWAIFRLVIAAREQTPRQALLHGVLIAGAVALGTMLAGCQLLPSLEFAGLNYRSGGVSYAAQVKHALAPPQLLLGIMPDAFGNPVDGVHYGGDLNAMWGRAYRAYTETAWYLGVAPLVLAAAGMFLRPRREAWFGLVMFVAALALAFGTPVNVLLRAIVPGYEQLTGVGRAVMLACTAGALLAGLGAESLLAAEDRERTLRVVTAVGLAVLLVGLAGGLSAWVFSGGVQASLEAAGVTADLGGYTLRQITRFVALLLAGCGLIGWGISARSEWAWWGLAVLIAVDMGFFMQKFTPEGPTEYLALRAEVAEEVRWRDEHGRIVSVGPDFLNRVAPNTHMILGLQSAQGSESLIWAPYYRLLEAMKSERLGFEQIDPAHPALDRLAVRWLLTPMELEERGWALRGEWETRLYENEEAAPRAFLAREVIGHPSEDAVLAAVTSEGDPRAVHVVGDDVEVSGGDARIEVAYYGRNSVELCGQMPPGSELVLADAAYPGWHAFADGVEVPVERANLVLRSVRLEDGAGRVRFVYLPASFMAGVFASLVALAILSGLFVATRGRRR